MESNIALSFTPEQKAIAENCIHAIAEKDINIPPEHFAKLVLSNIKAKGVRVTAEDVLTVFKVASDMGLDPSSKDVFAFKSAGIALTVGIGFRGWSKACEKKGILGVDYEPLEYSTDSNGNKIIERLKVVITKNNGGKVSYIITRSQAQTDSAIWKKEPDHMLQIRGFCRCASLAFGWGAYEIDEARSIYLNGYENKHVASAPQIEQKQEPVLVEQKIEHVNEEEFVNQLKSAKNIDDLRHIFAQGTAEQRGNQAIIKLCRDLAHTFSDPV